MLKEELDIIDNKISGQVDNLLPDGELGVFVNTGSKRIRSRLALCYIKANNKIPNENINNLLAASELIHNASLLHDDVIDSSDSRRGTTTVARKFSSNISILCGDYLVTKAVNLLEEINNREISQIFNNCIKNMAAAEIKQYFLRGNSPSIEDYLEICKNKTAGLFASILEGCAIILKLDRYTAKRFGEIFGICFQLKNDAESKSILDDVKNKILTASDIIGIENTLTLSDNYKRELNGIVDKLPESHCKTELRELIREL